MPLVIRQSQHYWVLAVCFLLIAVIYKGDFTRSNPTYQYSSQSSAVQQAHTQQHRAIESAVSGTIGIDRERGDSVFVVVKR